MPMRKSRTSHLRCLVPQGGVSANVPAAVKKFAAADRRLLPTDLHRLAEPDRLLSGSGAISVIDYNAGTDVGSRARPKAVPIGHVRTIFEATQWDLIALDVDPAGAKRLRR